MGAVWVIKMSMPDGGLSQGHSDILEIACIGMYGACAKQERDSDRGKDRDRVSCIDTFTAWTDALRRLQRALVADMRQTAL